MNRIIKASLWISVLFALTLFTKSCRSAGKQTTYTIGRDKSWYPLNLYGKEQKILGFTDDLLYTIAEREGITVHLSSSSHNGLIQKLKNGDIDAITTSRSPNKILNTNYVFSHSYFDLGPVLVVPIDSKVTSFQEMKGKIVGIPEAAAVNYDLRKVHGIIFAPFDNILIGLNSLTEGHIDGVVLHVLAAYEYVESFYKGELKIIPPPLTDEGLRLMSLKQSEESDLITHFNEGLKKIKEDGSYDKLLSKWGLFNPDTFTGLPQKTQ